MKKFLFSFLAVGLLFSACNKKTAENNASEANVGGYQIAGNINGLPDGKIYLYSALTQQPLDTTEVKGGDFSFTGKLTENQALILVSSDIKGITSFFAENNKTEIKGAYNDLQNIKVTGGQSQTEFEEYRKSIMPLAMQMQGFQREMQDAQQTQNQAKAIEINEKMKKISEGGSGIINNFIKTHPKSAVSLFVFRELLSNPGVNLEEVKATFASLDKSLQESPSGLQLKSSIEQVAQQSAAKEAIKEGQVAPDFTQNDPQGKPIALSSFKGKYVLVDFWASWCRPCRQENPNVIAAYNQFKNKNFEVLGVSLDDNKDAWTQAIAQDGLPWKHVSDLQKWSNAAARLYGVESIPFNVLLDPKGKIVAKNLRGPDLLAQLKKVLK